MLVVLRLGHRVGRDERISTHCGLVARALGADSIIYSGDHDGNMIEGLNETAKRWGGKFAVTYEPDWKKIINDRTAAGPVAPARLLPSGDAYFLLQGVDRKNKILFV